MKLSQIIKEVAHRPWPLPSSPWIMAQRWHDLLFAHWPISIATMRARVPKQLELDTFEGTAWVGVVPFRMSGVRPRGFPALPWLSAFPELNVRTYVRSPDPANPKPGVYFFSLEAANPVAVWAARKAFRLNYFNASMQCQNKGEEVIYRSTRTHRGAPPARFAATYRPTGGISMSKPGTLEHWLTERYCLYTVHKSRAYIAEIHHLPWPLQPAAADFEINEVARASGIELPDEKPLLHFSRRLQIVNWMLKAV
jgi:uncharacterized protein